MNEITNFINSCGFPIFVTIFLLYQQTKQNDIIAANTAAINRLAEKVGDLENGVKWQEGLDG